MLSSLSIHEIVRGLVRDRDLVMKLKIMKNFLLAFLLVIHKYMCIYYIPSIRANSISHRAT